MAMRITVYTPRVDAALAILRMVVGVIFLAHGAQKLFVFGLDGTAGAFGQMGIPYSEFVAPFIGFLEFFGGLVLVFGLFTRLASVGLAANMIGAITFVHYRNGFFLPNGYEFALTLLAASAALALAGAGAWSLDAWLASRRWRALGEYTRVPPHTGRPHTA